MPPPPFSARRDSEQLSTWTFWSNEALTNSPVSTGYHNAAVTVKGCAPGAVRLTCHGWQAQQASLALI